MHTDVIVQWMKFKDIHQNLSACAEIKPTKISIDHPRHNLDLFSSAIKFTLLSATKLSVLVHRAM